MHVQVWGIVPLARAKSKVSFRVRRINFNTPIQRRNKGEKTEGAHPCSPDTGRKCIEQFKRPDLFACINRQIVSVPTELENPLRTAGMTLEDDYGMINGIINNGRRGEELEKAQAEARRTTPEKKPSIRERLEDAKRECAERKSPDKPAPQKKPPEHDL